MVEAFTDARWAAIRDLIEGAAPTHQRVADAAGVYVKTIARRAGADGWKTLDFRHKRVLAAHKAMVALADAARAGEELDPVEERQDAWPTVADDEAGEEPAGLEPGRRFARVGSILKLRVEVILARIEAGQPVESRQVAALNMLVQLCERIAAMAEGDEGERQKKSDAETAAMLGKIEDQIILLGRGLARDLLVETFGLAGEEVDKVLAARFQRNSPPPAVQ